MIEINGTKITNESLLHDYAVYSDDKSHTICLLVRENQKIDQEKDFYKAQAKAFFEAGNEMGFEYDIWKKACELIFPYADRTGFPTLHHFYEQAKKVLEQE
jgi:hypothetical protein